MHVYILSTFTYLLRRTCQIDDIKLPLRYQSYTFDTYIKCDINAQYELLSLINRPIYEKPPFGTKLPSLMIPIFDI